MILAADLFNGAVWIERCFNLWYLSISLWGGSWSELPQLFGVSGVNREVTGRGVGEVS